MTMKNACLVFPLFLSLAFVLSISSCKTNKSNNRTKFGIKDGDSVCLGASIIVDTNQVTDVLTNSKKAILLIFTSLADDKSILNYKFLANNEILSKLRQFEILEMFVDDRKKATADDSLTIGQKNMRYQRSKFSTVVQPFYVIVSKSDIIRTSGYIDTEDSAITFLAKFQP